MPSAWGHTRLLETDWRLITQESHCFSCGSVNCGIYFLIWNYRMGQRIEKAGGRNEGIIYLLLAVFQLSIVSLALMQVAYNDLLDMGTGGGSSY